MQKESNNSLSAMMKKKNTLVLAFGIVAIIFFGAYYVSDISFQDAKSEVLQEEDIKLTTWVQGTSQSVFLWSQTLDEEAQRISNSELYRLFIQDVMANDAADVVNSITENSTFASEDMQFFVEQIPYLRDVLYEYVNYNGLTDARLVDYAGSTILSSLQRPTPVTKAQQKTIQYTIDNNKISFAPLRASAAGMVLDYAVPLYPLFSETEEPQAMAALLFTRPATSDIARFLARDLRNDGYFQPQIIQKVEDGFEHVHIHTPQPSKLENVLDINEEGIIPFARRMSVDGLSEVYSYGEKVKDMDMWVILEVSASILEENFASLAWTTYGIGFLVALGIILLFAMLWWMMIGAEQRAAADKFRGLYEVITQQKSLLDSINISLKVGLSLVNLTGDVKIFNKSFTEIVDKDEEDMANATLMSVFSGQVAGLFMKNLNKVRQEEKTLTFECEIPKKEQILLYRVTMYPFRDEQKDNSVKGVVATYQDITEFRRNSEKNKKQQANIINAFVRAIEGIDPYLTGHSQMMSDIGVLMCSKLEFSDEEKNIVHNASIFSQLGKLFIPREVLLKTSKLTDEEFAMLKQIPTKGYEVLSGIGFSDKIAETVYAMSENIDGSGFPQQLKGDEFLVYAKILAITNAFCALISNRAFRKGLPIGEALERLRQDTHKFDQSLVEILSEVIHTPEGSAIVVDTGSNEDTVN